MLLFLAASAAWILITDGIVEAMAEGNGVAEASRWQTAKGMAYVFGAGAILFVLLMLRERSVRAAEAAEAREALRTALLADSGLIGIYTWHPGGTIHDPNDKFLEITGYTREDYASGRLIWRSMLPEQEVQRFKALVEQIDKHGSIDPTELQICRKDETVGHIVIWGARLSDGTGFAAAIDVTPIRQAQEAARVAEHRYRLVVEYSSDAVVLCDGNGRASFASPAIAKLTGYTPEEFGQVDYSTCIHPADLDKFLASHARAMASRGGTSSVTHRFRRKDGEWVWLETTNINWMDEPGINALVGNVRDITERVNLQHQLNHASRMEGIGRLAGGVAHDFNNLLTAITGYAQLLEARLEHDSVASSQAQRILDAAGRATELTRQLLAFSRKQILQPVVMDLNTRVEGMQSLLRHIIGEDIELKISAHKDLKMVHADPAQLDQVIMNLAVNARDAMPKGGRLTVETQNVLLDESYCKLHPDVLAGEYVMLTVTDTGVGMDAATRSRVFEPFFTTKGPGKGTGLGLSTVYGIVRQSRGHVWLYSEPGKGTVFKVYLPATEGKDQTSPEPMPEMPVAGSETVLVAEDEDAVRTLVTEVLSMAGYNVLPAENGQKALEMLDGDTPSLLLTDVVMPGMSGAELANRVQASHPDIKVIYMSGYTDEAIVDQGMLAEGVEFIQKPFSPNNLLRRVRSVLDP